MTTQKILENIGKRIKEIRETKGMSQQDLAAMCNYEKSNMSRIESGKTNVTVGTINKIAHALNVSIIEFFV